MAYLNGLMGAVNQPTGMWESIISAFEGAVGNYIVAVILLTVVIKVVWSCVELLTKWNQRKMALAQAEMQPELDKLAKKYEKQPQLLQQKQNELRNRHMGKTQMGGCIIMLVIMALNMAIFFTLFAGLNSMAAYKSVSSYETTKFTYVNELNVTDYFLENNTAYTEEEKNELFKSYENIVFEVAEGTPYTDAETGEEITPKYMTMSYVQDGHTTKLVTIDDEVEFKTDFAGGERQAVDAEGNLVYKVDEEGNTLYEDDGVTPIPEMIKNTSNYNIVQLIYKYFPVNEEGERVYTNDTILKTEVVEVEGVSEEKVTLYLSQAIQNAIMKDVIAAYESNQEGFLWIKNIWVADSSFKQSVVDYGTIAANIGAKNLEAGEAVIYSSFMEDVKVAKSGANGYFILPVLCFAVAMLTTFINEAYSKKKYQKDLAAGKDAKMPQKTGKVAKVLMPAVMAIFALFYNSVFAIYMLVGQIVSMALSVPQLMIVDKIIEKTAKKKKAKKGNDVIVDYSRKF